MAVPKVILGKKEATYATDAVPTPAANAIVTRNFKKKLLEVDQLERNLDIPSRGRSQSAPTAPRETSTFEVEIAGSGVAGTAAAWMEILEACGMEPPALAANTDARQKFAAFGAAASSMTFYDNIGGLLSKGVGARGTYGWNFTAGQYPFWTFSFVHMLPPANFLSAAALGQPVFDRWKKPVEVNVDNTDILLGGYEVRVQTFTGEAAADVKLKNLTGERYIIRGNHAITGQLRAKCPNLGTKNYWTSLSSGDHVTFALTHGVVAGNIVQMQTDNCQILDIEVTEEDDELMLDIRYAFNVVAGQDDLLLIAK